MAFKIKVGDVTYNEEEAKKIIEKNKPKPSNTIILIIVGAILFAIGLFLVFQTPVLSPKYSPITAKVSKIKLDSDGNMKEISVMYTVDNKLYESQINEINSTFYEGKEIRAYYNTENPNDVQTNIMLYIAIAFIVVGVILLVISVRMVMKS